MHRLEQLDGLVARPRHHPWTAPETLQAIALRVAKAHVCGQLTGQPAHLAPAHGIGLPREGEGGGTGLAYPAGQQMRIDDGIGLVRPLIGLIDALAVEAEGARMAGEQLVETEQIGEGQIAMLGHRLRHPGGIVQLPGQGRDAADMGRHIISVPDVVIEQVAAQAVPERHIGAGTQGQMQVGLLRRHGAAGIHHHQLEFGTAAARLLDAAKQYRVCPGRVGPGDDDEIRQLQILIAGRDQILPERPLLGHHGRGHAEPGVGVDIGAADVALHQLVGHIVIFRGELPGEVDADRLGAGFRHDPAELGRHHSERLVPADALALMAGVEQTLGKGQGLQQAGPLDAECAAIGRMSAVPLELPLARLLRDADATANTAICTCGLHPSSCLPAIKRRPPHRRERTPLSCH